VPVARPVPNPPPPRTHRVDTLGVSRYGLAVMRLEKRGGQVQKAGLVGLVLLLGVPSSSTRSHTDGPSPSLPVRASELRAPHHCRFWGSVADSIPGWVIEGHLITLPNSICSLSVANDNGWSVGYYEGGDIRSPAKRSVPTPHREPFPHPPAPALHRGAAPAYLDTLFDLAVAEGVHACPGVAVSHIRLCSSGLCDIPNPHPFHRVKDRRHWLMGHNGTIDKTALLALIRPEYMAANPPQYGSGPEEWIDSDLYFIFMLQTLEDFGWRIKPALGRVVQRLREAIPGTGEQLNFFLTDGVALWAYRQGKSLYYLADSTATGCAAVASQYPSASQGDWIEMADGEMATLERGGRVRAEDIEAYFDPSGTPGGVQTGRVRD